MLKRRRIDTQLWAVAGSYRRRRRAVVVVVHLVLLIPAFMVGLAALGANSGERRAVLFVVFDVCVLAAGGASLALQSRLGQVVLDRLPVASSTSRLAYHVLRLHAVTHDTDQLYTGLGLLRDVVPILDATAHAARGLYYRLHGDTLARVVAGDLSVFAAGTADAADEKLVAGVVSCLSALAAVVATINGDGPEENDTAVTDRVTGDTGRSLTGFQGTSGAAEAADTVLALARLAVAPDHNAGRFTGL